MWLGYLLIFGRDMVGSFVLEGFAGLICINHSITFIKGIYPPKNKNIEPAQGILEDHFLARRPLRGFPCWFLGGYTGLLFGKLTSGGGGDQVYGSHPLVEQAVCWQLGAGRPQRRFE